MSEVVAVVCKLPNGLVLTDPTDASKTVELNGANKEIIKGSGYGLTAVPKDFWDVWFAVHTEAKDFAPLISGAVFARENAADAQAQAKEEAGRKTGLEPLDPKAHGVKPVPKDDKED